MLGGYLPEGVQESSMSREIRIKRHATEPYERDKG